MKKKIMIIGAGKLQLPAIIRAKELGHEVISVDMNPNAVGFRYADVKCVVSTNDIEGVLKEAEKLKPDGVMTLATDMPVRTVATVAEKLNLNSIDKETAVKVTDKGEMRKALRDKNIPIPKFFIVNNYEEYKSAIKNFSGSFIVKPADSSGSRGVFLVRDRRQATEAYNYSSKFSKNGRILVEEYMMGPEVSVEIFSVNGVVNVIAITDKKTTGEPYFVELGHSIPSLLDTGTILEINKVAKAAIGSIGIKNGPSHTEMIITEEGPKIVEIGARLGGDNITTHLVPLSTGINMIDLNIKYALNEKINFKRTLNKASAIRYISTDIGKIKQIRGIEEVKNIKGIKVIEIDKKVGDYIREIKSSTDRVGYVISQADNVSEANRICEEACNKIKIITT